jgi:hypothetical protein
MGRVMANYLNLWLDMDLKNYFDRIVVVNLKRRPDRLVGFKAALRGCDWPFRRPMVFDAVDGSIVPSPHGWQSGGGAWGCMRSHQRILEEALMDGVNNLLIMEDDACFAPEFRQKVEEFLREVPDDWDQLMLGGQHINVNGKPKLVKPGVYRCTDCERTHCYAVRGRFLLRLYQRWVHGGDFDGEVHCDWIMGRDPELQCRHNVYAPERFLVGQERGRSDIDGSLQPRKFWNPPTSDLPVIFLQASQAAVAELRSYGIHTGHHRDPKTDLDNALMGIFAETKGDPNGRVDRLRDWIMGMQWEVVSDTHLICTIWHPDATLDLVKQAARGPVYEISSSTVEGALRQLPEGLQRARRPLLAVACVIYLEAPPRVMEGLRVKGWHNGYWLDDNTGLDNGLNQICRDFPERDRRIEALGVTIKILQNEAEAIYQGVAVIWHPEFDAEMVQLATKARVVKITAKSIRDAAEQWDDAKITILDEPMES